jgi:hypothetical protein
MVKGDKMKQKCILCNIEKELNDFYKHEKMKNGHLNKCKSCCKIQSKQRTDKKSENKTWKEQEKKRNREKYHRLNYKDKHPYRYNQSTKKWRDKFPEKYAAEIAVQRIKCDQGFEKHHWSYKEEHYKSVIILSIDEHNFHHRHIIYDQEQRMYRSKDNTLLDTIEKYLFYINSIPKD